MVCATLAVRVPGRAHAAVSAVLGNRPRASLTAVLRGTGAAYSGTAEVTPTGEEQALHTAGLYLNRDITVHAIPSDYGRVTYDQDRVITVR